MQPSAGAKRLEQHVPSGSNGWFTGLRPPFHYGPSEPFAHNAKTIKLGGKYADIALAQRRELLVYAILLCLEIATIP